MSVVNFDPAGTLNLIFRKNRDGEKIFVFTDSNGDDFDISGFDFKLFIKKKSTSSINVLLLIVGDGLSISSNELTVTINETESNLPNDFYYWELYNVTNDETWINGNAYFITQSEDTDNTVSVTINLAVEAVTVTVQNGGSSESQYRGDFDPTAANLLPSTGGSGTGGAIKAGDQWTLTSDLVKSGKVYSQGTIAFSKVDGAGQTLNDWLFLAVQL